MYENHGIALREFQNKRVTIFYINSNTYISNTFEIMCQRWKFPYNNFAVLELKLINK